MPTHSLPLTASAANLKRLAVIRLILICALLLALAYVEVATAATIIHPVHMTILALFTLVNMLTFWRLQQRWPVTDLEYFCQLLFDILGLTVMLYVSGGATNPFVSYYLVPITISAALLPWRYTWSIAGLSLAAYSMMLFYYQPLLAVQPQQEVHMEHGSAAINLHILGMWMTFALSTTLITYFVVKMANALRQQQQQHAINREDTLRNEQILAVATLAAGTAHELGTPLATMTVLVDELIQEHSQPQQLSEDLTLLNQQLRHCKKILQGLVSTAEAHHPGHSHAIAAEDYIQKILDHWQVLRPEVDFIFVVSPELNGCSLQVDSTLEQAIVNLLNNAADANPNHIEVRLDHCHINNPPSQQVKIIIRDHGAGIDLAIAEQMGKPFISTKGKGLGLGLFLTHATVSRYGGSIKLFNHSEGGTQAELYLPLDYSPLKTAEQKLQ